MDAFDYRAETWKGGGDEYRGDRGPLATCNGNEMRLNPLHEAFLRAGEQAGCPVTADYNGFRQEGFGPMHMTVRNGVRCSTANAYAAVPPLAASNAPVWIDPEWETRQRPGSPARAVET